MFDEDISQPDENSRSKRSSGCSRSRKMPCFAHARYYCLAFTHILRYSMGSWRNLPSLLTHLANGTSLSPLEVASSYLHQKSFFILGASASFAMLLYSNSNQ